MLKYLLFVFVLVSLAAVPAFAAPDRYLFDKDHTHIIFSVDHEGFSDTIGRFTLFDGSFFFSEQEPEKSRVDVSIQSTSVDTGIAELDKALRGEKFLNATKFPDIRFASTKVVVTGNHMGDVEGNLTLLGVSRPILLHVKYNRSGIHPFTNNYVSGFSIDTTFKRSDFGMKAYIPDVGDDVHIHIEAEGIDPLKHPGNSKAPH